MSWPELARRIFFLRIEGSNIPRESYARPLDDATLIYAASLLSSAREEIDRADSKASILLAASGIAIGALLAGLMAGSWTPARLQVTIQWAWWVGVVEAAIAISCLALAVCPREQRNDSGTPWAVVFYGDVLEYHTTPQLVAALNRSAETKIERIADQLRYVCSIVNHKYRLVRWGILMLFLSAGTIAASIVINMALLNH
jgi:Family of unknown function (DUF5706)